MSSSSSKIYYVVLIIKNMLTQSRKYYLTTLPYLTVRTVKEQVRAAAEHKLGVANQSITIGFFDNNTSAEDRREYLESLLGECKKEEAAPVIDDDALNYLLARSESEIDIFEEVDKKRHEAEMAAWRRIVEGTKESSEPVLMPSHLVTDEDLKPLYDAMKIYEASNAEVKCKRDLGGLDTQHYGRGKHAREARSYNDQWTEEEFEKLCQAESPESIQPPEAPKASCMTQDISDTRCITHDISDTRLIGTSAPALFKVATPVAIDRKESMPLVIDLKTSSVESLQQVKLAPAVKRGRGRPRRTAIEVSPPTALLTQSDTAVKNEVGAKKEAITILCSFVDSCSANILLIFCSMAKTESGTQQWITAKDTLREIMEENAASTDSIIRHRRKKCANFINAENQHISVPEYMVHQKSTQNEDGDATWFRFQPSLRPDQKHIFCSRRFKFSFLFMSSRKANNCSKKNDHPKNGHMVPLA